MNFGKLFNPFFFFLKLNKADLDRFDPIQKILEKELYHGCNKEMFDSLYYKDGRQKFHNGQRIDWNGKK